jgi:hypothetical protein
VNIKLANQEHSNTLPPKSCTIDRLVTKEADINKVISGKKTATRRNRRYADVGEIMIQKGYEFIVTNVYSQSLGEVTDENAKEEGFENLEQYKDSILALHPGMRWVPAMNVWVHEFQRLEK